MSLTYTQTPGGPTFYRHQGGMAIGLYCTALGHAFILDVVNQDAFNNSQYWIGQESFFFATILPWSFLITTLFGLLALFSAYAGMIRYFIKVPVGYPLLALTLTGSALASELSLVWGWLSSSTISYAPYIQLYRDYVFWQLIGLIAIAVRVFGYSIKLPYKVMPPVVYRNFEKIDGAT